MKKVIYSRLIPIFACLIISFLVFMPYLTNNYICHADDIPYHLSRIEGLAKCIQNGNWFPKIYLFKNNGYGYAWPAFYCDLFLIIPALLYNIGVSIVTSYKVAVFMPIFLTAFISFFCSKILINNRAFSYILAVLLTSSSLFINDIYNRSALGSIWAWPFLILMLLGLVCLCYNKDNSQVILMIIFGFSGIVLSHNLSFFFALAVFILFFIMNIDIIIKNKKINQIVISGILSFGLCAYYLFPLLELKLSQVFIMDQNYSYAAYISTYVDLFDLAKVFLPMLIFTILLMTFVEVHNFNIKRLRIFGSLIIIAFVFIVCSSKYLNLPLTFTQLKSRTLPIAQMCIILVFAFYLCLAIDKIKYKITFYHIVIILMIINLCCSCHKLYEKISATNVKLYNSLSLSEILSYYEGYNSTVDSLKLEPDIDWLYLPANWNYDYTAEPCVVSLEEREKITCDVRKNVDGSTEISWDSTNAISNNILFPVSYYKGYKAHLYDENGNEVKLNVTGDWITGLVLINIPDNFTSGIIVVSYDGTKLQMVSSIISIISIVLLSIYIVIGKRSRI